ncbi:class I SAM-dependent methyltransferase [Pirellulales bacterium]|nr:class I SAM-dependent methyltransferase [Pirellulales bacterium]
MLKTIEGNLYDFPKYYDLVYGSDWKAEFDFLEACFEKHVDGTVQQLFEPACGTGRLLIKLANAGYDVSGLDLNPHAVRYCNDRLERGGHPRSAFVGDMTDFSLTSPADAAFNTINSFRHLATEQQADDHLDAMAAALRPGGIYVLGLHLTPTTVDPIAEESWAARRGNLSVLSNMRTEVRDLRRRNERVSLSLDVYTPSRQFRIVDELDFRTYTSRQFAKLLDKHPDFAITSVYDFTYDIDNPNDIGPASEDVVFVLKKAES